ncbi:zinc ribbon domain-containing protein [Oerskovia sp. M15]
MSAICPNGHASESTDYCDVCGEPMASAAVSGAVSAGSGGAASGAPGGGSAAAAGGEPITCPHCSFPAASGALFCENCGYDFTTGSLPEPAGAPSAATPSRSRRLRRRSTWTRSVRRSVRPRPLDGGPAVGAAVATPPVAGPGRRPARRAGWCC